MTSKSLIIFGSIFGFLAVAFGAFGAHLLEARDIDPDRVETWNTGVRYQMYHALALIAIGAIAMRSPARLMGIAGIFFVSGVLFFSGSIYMLVLTDLGVFGMLAAVGGTLQLIGWAFVIAGACKLKIRPGENDS